MQKLTIKDDYKPAPLNKKKPTPMIYRVDIIGWEKDKPLLVSESEKEVILNSLSKGSFVEIGNDLINPTSIRFIKATEEDTRPKVRYEKVTLEDGTETVRKIEI